MLPSMGGPYIYGPHKFSLAMNTFSSLFHLDANRAPHLFISPPTYLPMKKTLHFMGLFVWPHWPHGQRTSILWAFYPKVGQGGGSFLWLWAFLNMSSSLMPKQHFKPPCMVQYKDISPALRATSPTRMRARDHSTPRTLIGGKARAGPSLLHTTLEGPTENVNTRCTWISSWHWIHHVSWSLGLFLKTTSWR